MTTCRGQNSSHLNMQLVPFLEPPAQAHGGHQPAIWCHSESRVSIPLGDSEGIWGTILWRVRVAQDQFQDSAANGGVLLPTERWKRRCKASLSVGSCIIMDSLLGINLQCSHCSQAVPESPAPIPSYHLPLSQLPTPQPRPAAPCGQCRILDTKTIGAGRNIGD